MKRLILLCILLAGCDKEMQRVTVDVRQDARTVKCVIREYDCSHASITTDPSTGQLQTTWETETCYVYGNQDAIAEVTQYRSRYKSGAIKDWTDEKITQRIGACR